MIYIASVMGICEGLVGPETGNIEKVLANPPDVHHHPPSMKGQGGPDVERHVEAPSLKHNT